MSDEFQENREQSDVSHKRPTDQTTKVTTVAAVFMLIGMMLGAWAYSLLVLNQRSVIAEVVSTQIAGQENRIADQVIADIFGNIQGGQPRAQQPQQGTRFDVSIDDDPSIGMPDAPITIIEFSDFRCPYCGRFATTTLEPILEAYGDYVYFVYRDFAILGPESINAAIASECADDQNAFWTYHDLLFANQSNLSRQTYINLAEDLDLDVAVFTTCLDSEQHLDEVQADSVTVQQLGMTGTPTFFINGIYVSGAQPFELFAQIIEEELAAAGIVIE